MKRIQVVYILLLFFACKKTTDNTQPLAKIASIELKTSVNAGTYWAVESEPISFTVLLKDDKGIEIKNSNSAVKLYANEVVLSQNKYEFTTKGDYVFYAEVDGVKSTKTGIYTVKLLDDELADITISSDFYNKYAIMHGLEGMNPGIKIIGKLKNGQELPIQKGAKLTVGNQPINIQSQILTTIGENKISIAAYGKQKEITFYVRKPKVFDVVKIPLMFHFCPPSIAELGTTKITDGQFQTQALAQIKSGEIITQLNQMYRNTFQKNVLETDPNAVDSYVEFYLVDKDPTGKTLVQAGVNMLNFTKPYTPPGGNYDKNTTEAKDFERKLTEELKKWNLNAYLNIVVEPFGGWGYAGIGKSPKIDNARKNLMGAEYNQLPMHTANLDGPLFSDTPNTTFYDHIRINGAKNIMTKGPGVDGTIFLITTLAHELGHVLGLPHTFSDSGTGCSDNYHSDGLWDTPKQASSATIEKSCEGILFTQRNLMNYYNTEKVGYLTYDQALIIRSRIEAAFNIPSPRNKGKLQQ